MADNLIEPSKPETDDLEKILLKREADTTKALIPDSIKVPIVGGNIKPDPLDKPRRRGREERKEIFKREVEITKKVLERVNIEVRFVSSFSPQPSPRSSTGIKLFSLIDYAKLKKTTIIDQFRIFRVFKCSLIE